MLEVTWLGHASWLIKTDTHTLLLDPFFSDNPAAAIKAADAKCDFILVSHGHFDHVTDAVEIAKRTGAAVISNYDLCDWLAKQGVQNLVRMNLGGWATLPFGRVKMTNAIHSSMLPDGSYGGTACGFVLKFPSKTIYFACDTALFSDMSLIGKLGLDLAVVPIGDLFTMGPEDAIEAIKLLKPKHVLPTHYNTWPPINQDAAAFADLVRTSTDAEPHILKPGEALRLE